MAKILILLTNQATMGDLDEANGTYSPELTHAVHEFEEAGLTYDLVSIKGGPAPIYGQDPNDPIDTALHANAAFLEKAANTLAIKDIDPGNYGGVYYPGGFGLLWDLAHNPDVAAVTAGLYEQGKVVGAVCHGPAGLLPVTLSDGTSILEGKTVTAFTREEEIAYGSIDKVPFLVEDAVLTKAKAYTKVSAWGENVIDAGGLVTGQNPASAAGVARAMINRIAERRQAA